MALFEGMSFDGVQCSAGNPLVQIIETAGGVPTISRQLSQVWKDLIGVAGGVRTQDEPENTNSNNEIVETKDLGLNTTNASNTGNPVCSTSNVVSRLSLPLMDINASQKSSPSNLNLYDNVGNPTSSFNQRPLCSRIPTVYHTSYIDQLPIINHGLKAVAGPNWSSLFRRASLINKAELQEKGDSVIDGQMDQTGVDHLEAELDEFTEKFGEFLDERFKESRADNQTIEAAAAEIEIGMNSWRNISPSTTQNEYERALKRFIDKIDIADTIENMLQEGEEYIFYPKNPYLGMDITFLETTSRHKNITESILCLEAVVQQVSTRHDLWYELGRLHQINEADQLAIPALVNAVKYSNAPADALRRLAVSYTNKLDRRKAMDTIKLWIEQTIDHPTNHSTETSFTSLQSDILSELKTIPYSPESRARLSQLHDALGIIMINLDNPRSASNHFTSALVLNDNQCDSDLLNRLAASLVSSRDFGKAIGIYSKLLKNTPNHPRAIYNLGAAHYASGDCESAIICLMRALELQNNSVSSSNLRSYFPNVEKYLSNEKDRLKFRETHTNSILSTVDKLIRDSMPVNVDLERALNSKDISILSNSLRKYYPLNSSHG